MIQLELSGVEVKALSNRPELLPGLDFYLKAYNELSYDRPIGMTLGPIPWSSIDRYAARHGIVDLDDFAVLEGHIRAMETAVAEFDKQPKGVGRK